MLEQKDLEILGIGFAGSVWETYCFCERETNR